MSRLEANHAILRHLSEAAERNPGLRFGQLLVTMGVIEMRITHHNPVDTSFVLVDPFYEESDVTLARVSNHASSV